MASSSVSSGLPAYASSGTDTGDRARRIIQSGGPTAVKDRCGPCAERFQECYRSRDSWWSKCAYCTARNILKAECNRSSGEQPEENNEKDGPSDDQDPGCTIKHSPGWAPVNCSCGRALLLGDAGNSADEDTAVGTGLSSQA